MLSELIAVGGMGEVWAATDTVLGRVVAVKVLRTDNASALVGRFRDEARHTAALSHPGIAHVHDYGEDGSHAYLVMELVHGEPMSAVLARDGCEPVVVALSYLAQTAEALSAAHAIGVVHRDVKPGNLLIGAEGTVKVTDFGIARAVDSTSTTALGQVIGTAQYMSPEQAVGAAATPSSDIYSLGVVGYELLSGKPPFTGENPLALAMAHVHQSPPDLPEAVPEGVRSLISRSLAKDPADRPATAAIFASEARELQRQLMPSPVGPAAVAPHTDGALPPTEVFATSTDALAETMIGPDVNSSATAVMPAGAIPNDIPPAILDRDFVRQQRMRRRLVGSTIIAAVIVLTAVVLWPSSPDPGPFGASATDLATTSAAPATDGPERTTIVATIVATIPPTAVTVTASPATVFVDPDVLIGLKKDDATARLKGLGLEVVEQRGKGKPGDTVTGVEPSGEVARGSTITLILGGKKK
ncbi:MAG: serine/threonine protein kinase [Ilumatobacteraceae bacterium]